MQASWKLHLLPEAAKFPLLLSADLVVVVGLFNGYFWAQFCLPNHLFLSLPPYLSIYLSIHLYLYLSMYQPQTRELVSAFLMFVAFAHFTFWKARIPIPTAILFCCCCCYKENGNWPYHCCYLLQQSYWCCCCNHGVMANHILFLNWVIAGIFFIIFAFSIQLIMQMIGSK